MTTALAISAFEAGGLAVLQSLVTQSPKRQIIWSANAYIASGVMYPQVVVEEKHLDYLIVTEHPVEQGAAISDHAYKQPAELELRAGWSTSGANTDGSLASLPISFVSSIIPKGSDPNYLQDIYASLRGIQLTRALLTIITGKRTYSNMLLNMLEVRTDEKTENSLMIRAGFKEVIIVQTQVLTVPPADVQKTPQKTGGVVTLGQIQPLPATNFNPSDL